MTTPTQTSFAELEYTSKKRQARREKFLAEMEQVVPWSLLLAKLEPHYPQTGRRGRQPMPLKRMLRIHCMQQWFSSVGYAPHTTKLLVNEQGRHGSIFSNTNAGT